MKQRLKVKSGTKGGCFKKGSVPFNKGKTWDELGFSKEKQASMREHLFKDGSISPRAERVPIGHERVNRDGYIYIKVRMRPSSPGKRDCFIRKSQYVWEMEHGKAPEGTVFMFADRDKLNFDPDNIVAVPRSIAIKLKQYDYYDRETLELAIAAAKIDLAANKAKRRPIKCRKCGKVFEREYPKQRTCRECLG